MSLRDRLIDPRSPDRRPRRAAYALPTLFTAGNVFLGFYALLESVPGRHGRPCKTRPARTCIFRTAALAIGVAVFLDGLDGRIARMTNTTSDFGREMDSLADVITFGIAPAVLAFAWGIQFVEPPTDLDHAGAAAPRGIFSRFLFLLCGAARLARFNIRRIRFRRIRAGPTANISSACRSRRPPRMVAEHRVRVRRRAAALVGVFRGMAGAAGAALVSDGQHVALSQLQGPAPDAAAIAAYVDRDLGSSIYLIWIFSQPVLLALSVSYC